MFDPFDHDKWRLSKKDWSELMSSIQDLDGLVQGVKADLALLLPAVDKLEADVAALRASGGLSAADQATLDGDVTDLTQIASSITGETATAVAADAPPAPPAAAPVAPPSA